MGDTKSKKTISKLGRLFGMLHSDLTALPAEKPAPEHAARPASTKPEILSPAAYRPAKPSPSSDEDVLYPLPNERLRTTSPFAPTLLTPAALAAHSAVSPPQSVLSLDSLPQPLHLGAAPALPEHVAAMRSLPVSRLSSVARKTAASAGSAPGKPNKLNPVSRSLSVKRSASNILPSVSTTHLAAAASKPRFKMFEDGSHEHNLRAAKRQEKLSNMLKDLLGAKKLRDEAKSAVPNIMQPMVDAAKNGNKPPTLFAGLVSHVKNNTSPYDTLGTDLLNPMSEQDSRPFAEKYGRCQEVIGRGSFGVVRIAHKKADNTQVGLEELLYAVKEFKRRPNESDQKYLYRLTSEFCISSSLKHVNIIDTLDLFKDAKGDYCEVMQFCSGGDLYTLIIATGKLEYAEADCFFKQLIRGVNYMHEMGVAHRDLKPENLLLTQQGVLKITDFGNGECFKMAWENEILLSEGVSGSSPYIAPEEFVQKEFDPRCVDIWACGVIYMAMRTGRQLWKLADPKRDEFFQEYLLKRKDATGYEPIESLKRARCRNVIYSILDPIPERRINSKQILNSEWGREIKVCAAVSNGAVSSSPSVLASNTDLGQTVPAEKVPATA